MAYGQPVLSSQKVVLKAKWRVKGISCGNDQQDRLITLLNDAGQVLRVLQSTGCDWLQPLTLAPGHYTLEVGGLGLQTQQLKLQVSQGQAQIELSEVELLPLGHQLAEVTVKGPRKPLLKVEADKAVVAVRDNPLLASGSSLDAIKKIPGIVTSPTGGFSLNGKGVRIYIDGAPSSLSGTDLQNYLSTLPANAIEKVELIYNPGAAYDANASGSIINIVTNSKRLKGINASFNINYNFNQYQKPSPQVLLNGKTGKVSWQNMTGFNYIDSEMDIRTTQDFTTFNPVQTLSQRNFTVNTQRNLYSRYGFNYQVTSRSQLLVNYNLNWANDRNTFETTTSASQIDFATTGVGYNKNQNHESSVQYKVKLDTLGQTLDVTGYSSLFYRQPSSRSMALDRLTQTYQFNNTLQDFSLSNYYAKADWNKPIRGWNASFTLGAKINYTRIINNGLYNLNSSDAGVIDSGQFGTAIDFEYRETNWASYAEWRHKWRKWNVTLGARFEDYQVQRRATQQGVKTPVDFTNHNLFPNVVLQYQLAEQVYVNGMYSRKIAQPDYNALDPNNSANFDRYNSSKGNPLLNPTFFDNYECKISAFDFVQIGANYTVAKDNNRFVFSATPGSLVSNQTFQQFDRIKTTSFYASFPIPLDYFFRGKTEFQNRMSNIDQMNYLYLTVNYIKNQVEGYQFSFESKPIMNYAAQAQFIWPWGIKQVMNYFILTQGNWEIYKVTSPIQQLDISLQRNFLHNNLKVGLHAFDLFNQNRVTGIISADNLQTGLSQKQDSRVFRLSLTYNFGNLKLQKENTQIEVEKRQGGGGLLR